ncbi:class I SAM-dependent methyltransferase [uncultured Microbacterium sp.]|uniref:class I SAM-dependent methyltransferase n=1 Tax=uncultured Microbacterium sp. TaxID=191216 RepID=UPI002609F594|nr:class I SAM-dependent methyltransferase [uncultured Microbacterium sp.]
MTDFAVASAYDTRAAEYIEVLGDIAQMDAADRALIGEWRDATEGRLLDAGSGPGHWTAFLNDGHHEACGIDLSAEFVASAQERHPSIRFEVGTIREMPYADDEFGGVLAWYSLIHARPEELTEMVDELIRVLRPGGSILIGYFDGPPHESFAHAVAPAYFWSAESLSQLLADAGAEVVRSERRERVAGELSSRAHGSVIAVKAAAPMPR